MCDYIFSSNKSRFTCYFDNNYGEWFVKELIGNYTLILIDDTDYIYINNTKIQSNETFYDHETFNKWFIIKLLRLGISTKFTNNSIQFISKKPITINNGSYYFKKLLNLKNKYYISSINNSGFHSIIINQYSINMWYLLSSCGNSTIISLEDRNYYVLIAMKILINYKENETFKINNNDYKNKLCSNIIEMNLVDENLKDVRLVNPLYITIHTNTNENNLSFSSHSVPHFTSHFRKTHNERYINNKFIDHIKQDEKIYLPKPKIYPNRKGRFIFPNTNEVSGGDLADLKQLFSIADAQGSVPSQKVNEEKEVLINEVDVKEVNEVDVNEVDVEKNVNEVGIEKEKENEKENFDENQMENQEIHLLDK
jgi:hypothetical protein